MKGLLIVDENGEIKRTTMPMNETEEKSNDTRKYALRVAELSLKARSVVRDLTPLDDLTFFRVKGQREEILVAPGK